MDVLIETVLTDPALKIDHYKNDNGESYYLGISENHIPHTAKAKTAFECLLKFNIQLEEQKRLAGLLTAEVS